MKEYRRLQRASVRNKRVLVRAGLDVDVDATGRITDAFRIQRALPTLRWLRQHGARTMVLAHRGRPHGRVESRFSLRPVAKFLSVALHQPVRCIPLQMQRLAVALRDLPPRGIIVAENLRFARGEEDNSPIFAKSLSACGEIYVNDDFTTLHRAHASVARLPMFLPSYAGLNVQLEVVHLRRLMQHPRRPFVVYIGGAKVSDKLGVIASLLPHVDHICIGGAAANTCLRAQGKQVGRSLVDSNVSVSRLRRMLQNSKIILPDDALVVERSANVSVRASSIDGLTRGASIVDIGPATLQRYQHFAKTAATILWAGPLGRFEESVSAAGTCGLARAISRARTFAIAGGGDTLEAIHRNRLGRHFSFLSTGGGATLAYLSGARLPALEALQS